MLISHLKEFPKGEWLLEVASDSGFSSLMRTLGLFTIILVDNLVDLHNKIVLDFVIFKTLYNPC